MRNRLEAIRGEGLRARILRGAGGSIALKVAHTFLALGVSVLLARTLGPVDYGVYAYVLALIAIIAIPAEVGLPLLVMRETARTQSSEQWGIMRGLWRWANVVVFLFSLVLIAVSVLIVSMLAERFSAVLLATLAWGLAVVPLRALGNLRGAALRGLGKVVQGQLPEEVLRPGLQILLVSAPLLLVREYSLTAAHAMELYVIALAIAFAIGAWLLWRAKPMPVTLSKPAYHTKLWLASTMPLALTSGLLLINSQADIIILGLFNSSEKVGIYRVAVQGALLVIFGLQAINMAITPHFARLYALEDTVGLQRLVTLSARAILLTTFPVVIIFVVFGKEILGLLFGAEFVTAYTPLAILCLGQLVNATTGSVGQLLDMTGHEKDTAKGVAVAVVANIVLNLTLIPVFGINGAAIATAIAMVIWNLLLYLKVRQRLNIQSTAVKI